MDKLLEVREFDSIIGNADYEGKDNYRYMDAKAFDGLIDFIHEFTGNAETADALDFMRIGYKRHVGEVVSIKNYVGLIQMKK